MSSDFSFLSCLCLLGFQTNGKTKKTNDENISKRLNELGLDQALINLKGITPGMLVTLGEKKIKTLKDFAELSTDELNGGYDEIKGKRIKINGYLEDFALSREEADNLIMNARKIVFAD